MLPITQRFLFLCFICLLVTPNAKAQDSDNTPVLNRKIRWGLMLGVNNSRANVSKSNFPAGFEFKKSNKLGASIGLRAHIPVSEKISLQTGINWHYFTFQLTQTTLGIDTLTGYIETNLDIQSWEMPIILNYKLPYKNKLLKNFYFAGGIGLAMDHYIGVSNNANIYKVAPTPPGPGHSSNNYIPSDFYNGRSETGNVFVPNLIAGVGTDLNIFTRRKLQLNIWYYQGLKQLDQLNTSTIIPGVVAFPLQLKTVLSSFRYELVYFP